MRLRAPARRGQHWALKETGIGPSLPPPALPRGFPQLTPNLYLQPPLGAASEQEWPSSCSWGSWPRPRLYPFFCSVPRSKVRGGTLANPTNGCCIQGQCPQRSIQGRPSPIRQLCLTNLGPLDPFFFFYPFHQSPFPQIFQPRTCRFMSKMSMCTHKVYKTPRQRETFQAVAVMRIRCLGLGGKYTKTLNCPPGISFTQSLSDYFFY